MRVMQHAAHPSRPCLRVVGKPCWRRSAIEAATTPPDAPTRRPPSHPDCHELDAQNALPLITDKSYLRGGAGITALEAYHAGAVRTLLMQNANTVIQPWGVSVATVTAVRPSLVLYRHNSKLYPDTNHHPDPHHWRPTVLLLQR